MTFPFQCIFDAKGLFELRHYCCWWYLGRILDISDHVRVSSIGFEHNRILSQFFFGSILFEYMIELIEPYR